MREKELLVPIKISERKFNEIFQAWLDDFGISLIEPTKEAKKLKHRRQGKKLRTGKDANNRKNQKS
tara:strand:+ start:904 stop:1101 length:198 start_codon:yes stop_codon:yes gene_type:complete